MNDLIFSEKKIEEFVKSLIRNDGSFNIVNKGTTNVGLQLKLGFTCYAIKVLYTINSKLIHDQNFIDNTSHIFESCLEKYEEFPTGTYVDYAYYKNYKNNFLKIRFKNIIKYLLRKIDFLDIDPFKKFEEHIRAETKQAIATRKQINSAFFSDYKFYKDTPNEIFEFLNSLNWDNPWNAGAQVAGLSLFLNINEPNNEIIQINKRVGNYLESKVLQDGTYGKNFSNNSSERINGAMKVITALEWLKIKIHQPEQLIDTCLDHKPAKEGCDIVDVVYVLYMCNKETTYKSEEIKNYFLEILKDIDKHYFETEGGFSYYIGKSQTHYYGLKVSKGLNEPDLHGTTLLVWCLSMIYDTLGDGYPNWNIIRP